MPNRDPETGIHYGVIPKNALFNCAEEFFNNADDLTYRELLNDAKESVSSAILSALTDILSEQNIETITEAANDALETEFGDRYEGNCAQLKYKKDGYILESNNDDPELFVVLSPYYTIAPACNPCAPRAGYLRDAIKEPNKEPHSNSQGGPFKTYCLGHDWFEGDKAPYIVFDVKTNEIVNHDHSVTDPEGSRDG